MKSLAVVTEAVVAMLSLEIAPDPYRAISIMPVLLEAFGDVWSGDIGETPEKYK